MPTLNWLTRDADLRAASPACRIGCWKKLPSCRLVNRTRAICSSKGDNLEALKALLPFYAGQVKCIYIDPPYNTRSAFEHYDDNLEHTQWLALMWPRHGTCCANVAGRRRIDLGFN